MPRTSRLRLDRQLLAVGGSHAAGGRQVGCGEAAGHDGCQDQASKKGWVLEGCRPKVGCGG